MQAELQSEGEAIGEGEDSVVEAAAVTGVHIRNCHLKSWHIFLQMLKISHPSTLVCVMYWRRSQSDRVPLCTGYHVSTPGSAVQQYMADEINSPALTSAT